MASEDRLPTKEEIRKLPRWARVAFAVRCAKRLQPRVRKENASYAKEAIWLADRAARDPNNISPELIKAALNTAADAVYDREDLVPDGAYDLAAYAAHLAANPAYDAPFVGIDMSAFADSAAMITSLVRKDYAELLELADKLNWSDLTPVNPDILGSLWPDGEPEGWTSIQRPRPSAGIEREPTDPIAGPIRVYIDPAAYSPDEAGQVLSILSELYELEYGDRLVIDSTGTGGVLSVVPVHSPGGAS